MRNRITSILKHDVSWYLKEGENDEVDVMELDESTIEHIENCIIDGIGSGQIVTEKGTGWWYIIDWRDIATDLYNYRKGPELKKARERYNSEWNF
jgi:hypothetical protein